MTLGQIPELLGVELQREAAWESRTGRIRTCLSPQGITEQTLVGGAVQEPRLGR